MRKRFPWLLFILLFTILFSTGCEDEEGLLAIYAREGLGLILETDGYSYQPNLEASLINYINHRFDVQVINPRLLVKEDALLEEFCRRELGLKFLLTINLANTNFHEAQPNVDIWSKSVDLKITTSCSLTLIYTLRDLDRAEIINYGQSNGSSQQVNRVKAGKTGVHVRFKEIDYAELVEDAMFNALRRTELL